MFLEKYRAAYNALYNEDSLAKQLDRFEYKFAVPAGELAIGVPANLVSARVRPGNE